MPDREPLAAEVRRDLTGFASANVSSQLPSARYICDDCGRRFWNDGWHAEACGSPNYRVLDADEERDG